MITRLMGEKPYQYSDIPTRTLNQQVYANHYTLVTGDWFEVGGAYSLHITEKRARSYKTSNWWQPTERAKEVYVSESTLEKIAKTKIKSIFRSWEN